MKDDYFHQYQHSSTFGENLKGIFFDHRGRISASTFTSAFAILFLLQLLIYFILLYIVAPFCGPLLAPLIGLFSVIFSFVMTYAFLVMMIQRFHDLNSSGWLTLLMLIPLLNVILFFVLMFKRGSAYENNFGSPNTYTLYENFRFVAYPIVLLSMASPFLFLLVTAINYHEDIYKVINTLQEPVDKAVADGSIATISFNDQFIGVGVFITDKRILVRDSEQTKIMRKALRENQTITVENTRDQRAKISRFLASDDSIQHQMAVFEINRPIGKPGELKEENKVILKKIKAFQ